MSDKPMTAAEVVQCLIETQRNVSYYDDIGDESRRDETIVRRDRIKAALVLVLKEHAAMIRLGEGEVSFWSTKWRKLEEACRGKA